MKIYDLRTEYRENPIGLAVKSPRFSWKMRQMRRIQFRIYTGSK